MKRRVPLEKQPQWYQDAWLVYDTQTDEVFRYFWREKIAPKIEEFLKHRPRKKN